jgi:hypothetical protein
MIGRGWRHLGELRGDAIAWTFALLQRPTCVAGAFGMAQDLLIVVEIRGVAGQVLRWCSPGKSHVW